MARKSLPSKDKSQNGLSSDEFQKQLLNWFQDRGLLSDLQSHLRHQMIVALRDTSLNIHSAGAFHQAGSPKLQAINLLVAEFLLRQQCHYTLSVFTSEVPLLRNLPEFSTAISSSTSGVEHVPQEDGFPGFHERDVFDILEALGFASNSEESKIINDLYEHSQGESLLTCIIRSLPNSNRTRENTVSRSQSPESKNCVEQHSALQHCLLFTEDVRHLLQQSNLDAEQITLIHNAVKRIIEEEVEKVQKKEEAKFRQELIVREQRIQEVWNQHDTELQEIQSKSDEKLNEERLKLEKQLNKKEAQFVALASQLKAQQHDVASQLSYIQERGDLIEQKETELNILRKESEEYLVKRQEELNMREKQLEEQLKRLEAETIARDQEKRELQANCLEIEAASRAIKESQSEIALLRELHKEHHLQLQAAQESFSSPHKGEGQKKKLDNSVKRKKSEFSSQGTQVDIHRQKGAVPKKHNAHQQTSKVSNENQSLQTQISASDLEDVFLQLHQQNAENERQRSQHTMLGNLVDQLQQENLELRGHIEQQRRRIQELTTQASEFMHQLSNAHNSLTRLRSRAASAELNTYGVQTSPRPSTDSPAMPMPAAAATTAAVPPAIPVMDSVPGLALGAYGYHSPPPAPPPPSVPTQNQPRPVPEPRPPARGFVRSSQVGAGEESYFSRRLPPESFVPLYSSPNHREQRRKPPRRLMVHSVSSSDESCPSPTEEMLREARRRLRRLEEETAAIDRSYQEFRLRHADSLTNTASILFQPITNLSRDYNNFSLPTAQNMPPRNVAPNPPVLSFPTSFSRSRLYAPHIGLLNPFPSTTILQHGVMQPIPLFPVTRGNDQTRQSVSFTSVQVQSSPAITPLYTVPTEVFSARPQSTQGRAVTTAVLSVPPLSSARVNSNNQNIPATGSTADDLRLPVGFNLRGQTRYSEERQSFPSDSHQQNVNSSRWLQELPPCTSSVPHMPVSIVHNENEKHEEASKPLNTDEKPLVFLHQDSQHIQKPYNTSRELLELPVNSIAASESQAFEISNEISLQSASDENIKERSLSPPLRVSKSAEHDRESRLLSAKSCTELDGANKLQAKQSSITKQSESPEVSQHSKSESVVPKDEVPPSNLVEHSSPTQKRIPQNNDQVPRLEALLPESSIASDKKGDQNSEKSEKQDSTNLNSLKSHTKNSESQENHQSSNSIVKSDNDTKVSESLSNKSQAKMEQASDTEEYSPNNYSIRRTPEKENLRSKLEAKAVSKEQLLNDVNDTIQVNTEEQYLKAPEPCNSADQQSLSSSLPGSLGSSNELSSNIVSAGEEKTDNSW